MSNLRIEQGYWPEEESEEPTSEPTVVPSIKHENTHNGLMSTGAAVGVSLAFIFFVSCTCICIHDSYCSGIAFDNGISNGWQ